jgi:hypothetical protein
MKRSNGKKPFDRFHFYNLFPRKTTYEIRL